MERLRGPAVVEQWLTPEDIDRLRQALLDGAVDVLEEYQTAMGRYGVMLTPPEERDTISLDVVLREVAGRRQAQARDAYAEAMGWRPHEAAAAFVARSDG